MKKKWKLALLIAIPIYVVSYFSVGIAHEKNLGSMMSIIASLKLGECKSFFVSESSMYIKLDRYSAFFFRATPSTYVDIQILGNQGCLQSLMKELTKRSANFNIIVRDHSSGNDVYRISN